MRAKKSSTLSFDPILFDTKNFNHSAFLQKQGENSLQGGDTKGLHYFDLAAGLDQENPKLFYEQGLCLAEYGRAQKKKKYLLLANKKFKLSVKLQPEFANAWHAWANTLFCLGELCGENHFFRAAKEKFLTALRLAPQDSILHYDIAMLMKKLAGISGEVSDLQEALTHFKAASSTSENLSSEFWQSYGNTSLLLGLQLGDSPLLLQAISFFKEGLRQNNSAPLLWMDLANALSHLYEITYDEDHFCQANECFMNSAKLHPQNADLWALWALFLKDSGKRLGDAKRLRSATEKCQRALLCNRKNPLAITVWSESLAELGLILDKIDLIYEAHNKALDAIEKGGPSPSFCKALGNALFALGEYYDDLDYYYQAIEQFQEGLSIDRTCHELWYLLGSTYTVAAEIEDDVEIYERATRFFAKAIHLHSSSTYYFAYASALSKLAIHKQDQQTLETAILHFEQAFSLQKNTVSLHPEPLFQYASLLDAMGDLSGEEIYYEKSIEIFARVLLLDPDYPDIHFRIGLVYTHLGELSQIEESFLRAIQHFKLAYQDDEENDGITLEWGLALMNLSELLPHEEDRQSLLEEAEFKLMQSAKLGNPQAYYHLACLFSIQNQFEKAFSFLKKAADYDGMPPLDDVLEDLWLEGLRTTDNFRHFFERPEAEK